jgi:hypothetical protein
VFILIRFYDRYRKYPKQNSQAQSLKEAENTQHKHKTQAIAHQSIFSQCLSKLTKILYQRIQFLTATPRNTPNSIIPKQKIINPNVWYSNH